MNLFSLVQTLRVRPRMFLPDSRYASFVAVIEGFALGRNLRLAPFQEWLVRSLDQPAPSSLNWGSLVANHIRQQSIDDDRAGSEGGELTESEQSQAASLLLEKLEEYLLETESLNASDNQHNRPADEAAEDVE